MNSVKTAILVDGGFYRKLSRKLWGEKSPKERAEELRNYCYRHLKDCNLYRIFYYDCPWNIDNVFNPIKGETVNFKKNPVYTWSQDFFQELKHQRKFALRMGRLSGTPQFVLADGVLKKLTSGKLKVEELTEKDLRLDAKQKGVDMRIGIDITTLALKKQVDQIVLIAGDSDFVPAAKLARREGIDFILDPLRQDIAPDLFEHIDGLRSCFKTEPQTDR